MSGLLGGRGSKNSSSSSPPASPVGAAEGPVVGLSSHRNQSLIPRKVDQFGFIVNLEDLSENNNNGGGEHSMNDNEDASVPLFSDAQKLERRVKKWNTMMASPAGVVVSNKNNTRRQKLVLKRLRKGLPDTIRGKVWIMLGEVDENMKKHAGLYKELVKKTIVTSKTPIMEENGTITVNGEEPPLVTDLSSSIGGATTTKTKNKFPIHTRSFKNLQDTIERDIHRTFPRHTMFYDDEEHEHMHVLPVSNSSEHTRSKTTTALGAVQEDEDDDDDNDSDAAAAKSSALCAGVVSDVIEGGLEFAGATTTEEAPSTPPPKKKKKKKKKQPNNNSLTNSPSAKLVMESKGGQASLRRVLKAYSLHDRDVGYCQGMNFIAGMFLTLMSEEQAFWLLVYVMSKGPCKMRGLFREGMSETHQVLYVAEKLLQQFLPKLSKHLDAQHIHITMFATQWLLTQYSSSFRFDLVLRVWDCFLCEGWKITYRVMLAILTTWQSTLLKMNFEELLGFFRDLPDRVKAAATMEAAMKIPLKTKHVVKYEKEWMAEQQQQAKKKE